MSSYLYAAHLALYLQLYVTGFGTTGLLYSNTVWLIPNEPKSKYDQIAGTGRDR